MTPITLQACVPLSDDELARFGSRDDQGLGWLACARGRLPLTAMDVRARLVGLCAEIELTQTFQNTLSEAIEATYIFPLPDRAAVNRFRMEVAGRLVEGVIDERAKARANYEEAIAAGQRAAIVEEDRPSVFSLQVGNLGPGEIATLKLTLVSAVPVDSGEATFQFPLVVAPRYVPGRELPGPSAGLGVSSDTGAVPDASRISPPVLLRGCENPVRLSLEVVIVPSGVRLGAPRSSLHAVLSAPEGGGYRVKLEPGERLDRDFILRFPVVDAELQSTAVLTPDREGSSATLSVTLLPPRQEASSRARDVVFLLDRSGSMDGWKMVAARRAVSRMADTLTANDRFAVVAFSDGVESPPELSTSLESATDRNRYRAVEFLARLEARGGTELREPLVRAATSLAGGYEERQRLLVLVTDGQVGNEDEILRELMPALKNVRIFTLGIDRAVNAGFLRRLAALGGGTCELVESEDRLDEVMDKVHRRIATPLVTELALSTDGFEIEADTQAPARLPALFAGAPLVIWLRTQGVRREGHVILTGRTPGGEPFRQSIPLAIAQASDAPAALWARAHIRDLEDRYITCPPAQKRDVERRIVTTSLAHRVLSRFTAFLAVDTEIANPGGDPRPILQAVEAPSGWSHGVGLVGGIARAPGPMFAAPAPSPMAAAPMGAYAGAAPAASESTRSSGFGGFVERTRRAFRGEAARTEELGVPFDVEPYLVRAGEIAEQLERSISLDDRRGFDLAIARLTELVEDLFSIGEFDTLRTKLERILSQLRAALGMALASATPTIAELRALLEHEEAREVPQRSTRPFWK
ncbi:MAG: VIT domain-containing protein [Myxococcota bacterium]